MIFFDVNNENNYLFINHLKTRNPKMVSLKNSEDQEEMPNSVAFFIVCKVCQTKSICRKRNTRFFGTFNLGPLCILNVPF